MHLVANWKLAFESNGDLTDHGYSSDSQINLNRSVTNSLNRLTNGFLSACTALPVLHVFFVRGGRAQWLSS